MESLDNILSKGERVYVKARFSLWITLPSLFKSLLLFSASAGLMYFDYTRYGGYAVAALGALSSIWSILKYRNSLLLITDRRLIAQTGWPGRDILDFPYTGFESARVSQSFAGRLFDYGEIEIIGLGSTIAPLDWISSPLGFKRALDAARAKSGALKPASLSTSPSKASSGALNPEG